MHFLAFKLTTSLERLENMEISEKNLAAVTELTKSGKYQRNVWAKSYEGKLFIANFTFGATTLFSMLLQATCIASFKDFYHASCAQRVFLYRGHLSVQFLSLRCTQAWQHQMILPHHGGGHL